MRLDIDEHGDTSIVRIHEKITVDSSQELRATVLQVAEGACKEIVLDLSAVPFIDSSGLGILLGLRKQLLAKAITLSLSNPQDRVLTVLRLTRLAAVFDLEQGLE